MVVRREDAGRLLDEAGAALRLKTSSMSLLGPTYSMLGNLKDAFLTRGMCSKVLRLEWKRRLMQSSTNAIRPLATMTLRQGLVLYIAACVLVYSLGKVRLGPQGFLICDFQVARRDPAPTRCLIFGLFFSQPHRADMSKIVLGGVSADQAVRDSLAIPIHVHTPLPVIVMTPVLKRIPFARFSSASLDVNVSVV